ncbi:MAG: lytic transglycosylase domain-containing protein [bacterium]|nr:lytic transglycosylase domain-containing protein [bacterium]
MVWLLVSVLLVLLAAGIVVYLVLHPGTFSRMGQRRRARRNLKQIRAQFAPTQVPVRQLVRTGPPRVQLHNLYDDLHPPRYRGGGASSGIHRIVDWIFRGSVYVLTTLVVLTGALIVGLGLISADLPMAVWMMVWSILILIAVAVGVLLILGMRLVQSGIGDGWWGTFARLIASIALVCILALIAPIAWAGIADAGTGAAAAAVVLPPAPVGLSPAAVQGRTQAIAAAYEGIRNDPDTFAIAADVFRYRTLVDKYAADYDLDPLRVAAMIAQESAGDPDAMSSAGALGLMQLMPKTALEFGSTSCGLTHRMLRRQPQANICTGTAYYRHCTGVFRGDGETALAAYNAGEHRVQSAFEKHGNPTASFWTHLDTGALPQETRDYVPRVLAWEMALRFLERNPDAPLPPLAHAAPDGARTSA